MKRNRGRRYRRSAVSWRTSFLRRTWLVLLSPFPGVVVDCVAGHDVVDDNVFVDGAVTGANIDGDGARSEEHTSELQSRGHLVCRLLLEKKQRQAASTGSV